MATTGTLVCRPGYGKASWYVQLLGASDALVLVVLQWNGTGSSPNHQDDQVLRDHANLASLLGSGTGNVECTAPNYTRGVITNGASETYDDTNNRVDSNLADFTWPALGAITGGGVNAEQRQAAVLMCYRPNNASPDSQLLPILKMYFPFVADGSDRTVPLSTGFLRATGG